MPRPPKRPGSRKSAVTKADARPVLVYFPEDVVDRVDAVVLAEDTDRSKWIRLAIREALQRRGVTA
jgi:metal-responsive CopG/Arc/MetJ family transcriptional regulator